MKDKAQLIAAGFIVLVIAVVAYFNISAAIDCQNRGGQQVRNWANWPVCIGAVR